MAAAYILKLDHSRNPIAAASSVRSDVNPNHCQKCDGTVMKAHKCANCLISVYCSKKCLVTDMPKHRYHCDRIAMAEKIRAVNVDNDEKASHLAEVTLSGESDVDSSFVEARRIYEAAKANFANMRKVVKTAKERLQITALEERTRPISNDFANLLIVEIYEGKTPEIRTSVALRKPVQHSLFP